MFQQTSHFQNNLPTTWIGPKQAAKPAKEIDNKTLEDWSYRIEQCAYEAEDERLMALYNSLLDLRDDIVHHLHRNV